MTRRRRPQARHRDGATVSVARANTRCHLVLGLVLAVLILHPQLRTWPLRILQYALLIGCIAYFFGSMVQRQKIVIATNQRRR